MMRPRLLLALALATGAATPSSRAQETPPAAPATPATPRALQHGDDERWRRIGGQSLSSDGQWVLYSLRSAERDAPSTLIVQRCDEDRRYEVLRGTGARFTRGGRFVVYLVSPDPEAVKQAKKEKKKPEEQPKSKLEILDLRSGDTVTVPRVRSFDLPEESSRFLSYLLEKPVEKGDDERAAKEVGGEPATTGHAGEPGKAGEAAATEAASGASNPATTPPETEVPPAPPTTEPPEPTEPSEPGVPPTEPGVSPEPAAPAAPPAAPPAGTKAGTQQGTPEEASPEKDESRRDPPGTTLVLRDLETGTERRFEQVASSLFDEAGRTLVYVHTPEATDDDAVVAVDLASGKSTALVSGRGQYRSLRFDESGERLLLLTDRDHQDLDPAPYSLYLWRHGEPAALPRVTPDTEGLPEGHGVAEDVPPSFSKSGGRVLFSTRKLPEQNEVAAADAEGAKAEAAKAEGPAAKGSTTKGSTAEEPDEEAEPEVKVDIWHWQDPLLQPMQLLQAERERKRSYPAVLHLDQGRVVQLGTPEVPRPSIGQRGDGDHALDNVGLPYRMQSSWDSPGYNDVWVVDVRTGERSRILTGVQTSAQLSPGGKFAYWFDRTLGHWFARSLRSGQVVNLTELLPHPVANVQDDHPYLDGPYGLAGWSADDMTLLVYDEFDVWATNPAGFWPPMCVTDGLGRERGITLRYVRLDREQDTIPADQPLLLSAFDQNTKASGFFVDTIRSNAPPTELYLADERISSPTKAEDADRYLFTRQTFRDFPDLWIADTDFQGMRRLSEANPQQAEYRWGSAELFEWTSADGEPLQGLLYKPDGFDPTHQYPMMVYFYERNSQNLHRYVTPAPGSSSINWSFYVSRGYLLFIPDIPYREGYPGRSAEIAILPGVARLIDTGFVDRHRIGVQGHSWGGYQSAHLITQTDIFACAESGAPVSNMTSAYGGIRWASGMSRMFQYEKTQSRIGGTLWESLPQYLENSPLFHVPKIHTPLLILHNDEDGAVPWYQGIELFVAMRRLGKPCWMFNYNGEAHGLRQRHNQKDWTIRLQQFFDHYLMDAPAPRWLQEGVPAVEKGENLGLDLMPGTADRR